MKMTITVASDGQTTLDVYDIAQAIINEMENIKIHTRSCESAEEVGSLGKIGVAKREDGPSGKWTLEVE